MEARRPGVTIAAAICGALLLSCSSPAGPPPVSTALPPATASGSTPPSGSGTPPASDWKTFTTSDGGLSFDFPSRWSVRDPAGEMPLGGEFVDVVNQAGKPMASLRTNIVTGADCTQKYPFEVFDSEPMQALAEPGAADTPVPRYVFEARGDATAPTAAPPTIAGYGITMVPEETGSTACPMFLLFLWPPSGALFGAAYNPENNTTPGDPSLPYLAKAKLYAATPEYQDIRKMITSLRPAGNEAGK
ncbi:hypothetical protein [Arthrobacter sp. UYEF20]|uniref:hypothetical protein n=1 Tax=Arthrobacter sp. UYEF20 TaxID=1756363 RepID=UPI00339893D1